MWRLQLHGQKKSLYAHRSVVEYLQHLERDRVGCKLFTVGSISFVYSHHCKKLPYISPIPPYKMLMANVATLLEQSLM
ncbi:Hypothetical predicted protein [Octopus vulgaris]|uniref:Uncharacterized protein n=1 Tax=Octopus vulgaris TaxID=6645 RepID=A0AA36B9D1_OCTVU|nr:Hypothetical predicted protein [Octopus vulgaris]